MFIYDVIKLFMGDFFRGYRIRGCAGFRVTRNSILCGTDQFSGRNLAPDSRGSESRFG